MKGFREQLEEVRAQGLFVSDIVVANSCDCYFNFKYTNEEFERLCAVVQEVWMASGEVSEDDIAYAINELVLGGRTIDEICGLSKWDLLDYAVNGVPDNSPWCEECQTPDDCVDCDVYECDCNPKYVG